MMADKLKPGTRMCFCRSCGEHFGSVSAFDGHRVGPWSDRRCEAACEMRETGLEPDARGVWRMARSAAA